MPRKAFTLVEVLAALVILAVLIAFLLPSRGGRGPARRTVCLTNLKLQGTTFAIAAADNGGKWPASAAILTSLCQQTVEAQNAFLAYSPSGASLAALQKHFYCPLNTSQDPATLWSSAGISTWGYVWLNDRGTSGALLPATFPSRTVPLRYLATSSGPNLSRTILAQDVIITNTATPPFNYSPTAPPIAVPFGTNHIPTGTATNYVNVLFADGHTESLKFTPATATPVPQPAGGFLWFPNP